MVGINLPLSDAYINCEDCFENNKEYLNTGEKLGCRETRDDRKRYVRKRLLDALSRELPDHLSRMDIFDMLLKCYVCGKKGYKNQTVKQVLEGKI